MPTFEGANGPVYYRDWLVSRPRASAILVHGVGEHSGLYERFAAALTSAGIAVRALDQIGHGRTPGPRGVIGSANALEADLRTLVTLAATQDPALPQVAIGHSLGGIVVALSATRHPQSYAGIVLSGTTLSAPAGFAGGETNGQHDLDLDASELSSDPEYLDWLATDPLVFTGGEEMNASLRRVLPAAWDELGRTLPALSCPLLFVHGEADQVAPVAGVREWCARLPGAALRSFAGARHDVLNETVHGDVEAAICDFIRTTAAVS